MKKVTLFLFFSILFLACSSNSNENSGEEINYKPSEEAVEEVDLENDSSNVEVKEDRQEIDNEAEKDSDSWDDDYQ